MPSNWTPEREAEVLARCEAATEGPWEKRENIPYTYDGVVIFSGRWESNYTVGRWANRKYLNTPNNVDFIAAARTDLPDAIAEIRRLRGVIADIEADIPEFVIGHYRDGIGHEIGRNNLKIAVGIIKQRIQKYSRASKALAGTEADRG